MTIAILGSGPAGLFAAHACAQAGEDFTIFSKGQKSEPFGPLYMREPIPGLSGDPFTIRASLRGDVAGYRAKSGGPAPDTERVFEAWDLRAAYDAAWQLYRDKVEPADFERDPWFLDHVDDLHHEVVSTIPANLVCRDITHRFFTTTSWLTDNIKAEQGEFQSGAENFILYSGDPDDWWLTQTRILGRSSTEFPADKKPRRYAGQIQKFENPSDCSCDCFPNFWYEGRLGAWNPLMDAVDAYLNAAENLA